MTGRKDTFNSLYGFLIMSQSICTQNCISMECRKDFCIKCSIQAHKTVYFLEFDNIKIYQHERSKQTYITDSRTTYDNI